MFFFLQIKFCKWSSIFAISTNSCDIHKYKLVQPFAYNCSVNSRKLAASRNKSRGSFSDKVPSFQHWTWYFFNSSKNVENSTTKQPLLSSKSPMQKLQRSISQVLVSVRKTTINCALHFRNPFIL